MAKSTPRELSLEILRSRLLYSPDAGTFVRKQTVNGHYAGSKVGWVSGRNYLIGIEGKIYVAARLAWFYVHGVWPPEQIDHINCDPLDNRLANLRLASPSEQARNKRLRADNACGYKGVYWHKSRREWIAKIQVGGKQRRIGGFKTAEQAHMAYCDASPKFHGEFGRTA